jgi:hypothetical protein
MKDDTFAIACFVGTIIGCLAFKALMWFFVLRGLMA